VLRRVFNKTNDHDIGFPNLYHVSSWGADRTPFWYAQPLPPSLFRPNARTNALSKLPNLQTLIEIAAGKNSTTIFPIPIDTIAPFLKGLTKK
jgi:hypothetical protein